MALFCKDRIAQRIACPVSPVDGKFRLVSTTLLHPLACAIGHTSLHFMDFNWCCCSRECSNSNRSCIRMLNITVFLRSLPSQDTAVVSHFKCVPLLRVYAVPTRCATS